MKVPVLETERLLLRPLSLEDAEEIFQNWTSDPEVARFMRWNTHQSVEDTREWLRSELDDPLSPSCYDWGFVCKTDGRLIGSGGLVFQEQKGMYELGYNLMKKILESGSRHRGRPGNRPVRPGRPGTDTALLLSRKRKPCLRQGNGKSRVRLPAGWRILQAG